MKAIIPAAGLGTRFLPVTRAVPKEMLPIGSKPALELLVEEAKGAGAEEIVVVISPGKELIREYFKGDASISFVYQREQRGLGHAVLQAADAVRGETSKLLVLLGDAVVVGCNASLEMVRFSASHGGASVLGLEHVPMEKVSRYGIVKMEGDAVVGIVEKPRREDAPSDLAVAGRYLLDPSVMDFLAGQGAGYGGEIQLTDAIGRMIAEKPFVGFAYPGRRQDIGNPEGYFKALEAYYGNR